MTVSLAEISKSESQSQISQLPTTHQMKTQQLYTSSVRKMQEGLKQKVGSSMIMHGPPRLSVQEQRENKPLPDLSEYKSDNSSTTESTTTRQKIANISGDQPKLRWKAGEKPRASVPGVNLKKVNDDEIKEPEQKSEQKPDQKPEQKTKNGPTVKKVSKNPVVLAKKETKQDENENKKDQPNNVIEAERLANKMLRAGNFSTLGNTTPFRA